MTSRRSEWRLWVLVIGASLLIVTLFPNCDTGPSWTDLLTGEHQ